MPATGAMITKIINKEHVHNNAPSVALAGKDLKGIPNGSISKIRSNFPEEQNGDHISWPYSNESMHNIAKIEKEEFHFLFHLFEHTYRY